MEKGTDWTLLLQNHPIFSLDQNSSEELHASELSHMTANTDVFDEQVLTSRRQVMCMRDSDVILAMGAELRMLNLAYIQSSGGSDRNYRVMNLPGFGVIAAQH